MNYTPVILEHVGRCRICGRTDCRAPKCLSQALEQHWTPPVVSRATFDRFVATLVRGGASRADAARTVRRTVTPAA